MKNKPDWLLILLFFLLLIVGWVSIYFTVYQQGGDFSMDSNYGMQLIWIASALFIGLFVLVIHKRFYYNFAAYIYMFFIALILLVFFIGIERSGAKSWLGIGGFGIQPAEFAKYGACLLLSRFLSLHSCDLTKWKQVLIAAVIILIPVGLILLQNDTGSAIPFLFLIFALFREGLSPWILIVGIATVLLFALVVYFSQWMIMVALTVLFLAFIILFYRKRKRFWTLAIVYLCAIGFVFSVDIVYRNVVKEHQRKRIELLLGKIDDPKGSGFNVNQSMIAIGSGGLLGKGFGEGTQTRLNFVPEQTTDFIFCTIGEEHGFVGAVLVILLYIFFIWRIIILAEKCDDAFVRSFGYCIASIFFAHIMINIGMTIGLMPVIGIPLPFISYGGSSLWAFTLMIFTFLSMSKNKSIINMYGTEDDVQ
ncbi:MAG: rod shape-determining protein RodA [Bacteroidales bacterium]|jgi:rod shape determining protein RodA|nr:rod shape-determining protein RodA [Bacteroidales bacterium]